MEHPPSLLSPSSSNDRKEEGQDVQRMKEEDIWDPLSSNPTPAGSISGGFDDNNNGSFDGGHSNEGGATANNNDW